MIVEIPFLGERFLNHLNDLREANLSTQGLKRCGRFTRNWSPEELYAQPHHSVPLRLHNFRVTWAAA
jgi:hypothetical protein